jgi:hypothetical protein
MNYENYGYLQEITKTLVLEELKLVVENFLGYHVSPYNKQLVQRRLQAHRMIEHSMLLKIQLLRSHLDLLATFQMSAVKTVK